LKTATEFATAAWSTTTAWVGRLLELCQKSGDRPTDISFGLGLASMPLVGFKAMLASVWSCSPAVRRKSAQDMELANARRKSLQKMFPSKWQS